MPVKDLSPFPPDRWIRELNRQYPSLWADLRKARENPGKIVRKNTEGMKLLSGIPDWCIMPTMFPFLTITERYGEAYYLLHMHEIMTIGSMYLWRAGRGVYRFSPEVYDALIHQPLSGNLPIECLYHLPEWAVYIETPGLLFGSWPMDGFIAHLDYNLYSKDVDLQFAIFLHGFDQPRMIALPLASGSLLDAMNRTEEVDSQFLDPAIRAHDKYLDYKPAFSSMIQLLLYLCSDEPDMPEIEHPKKRVSFSGGIKVPREPRVWDVGVRISAALRRVKSQADSSTGTPHDPSSHSSPRPHIRSAHWHTFWVGPRTESFPMRRPVIRWVPPIPVNVDWKKPLPTTIKNVG